MFVFYANLDDFWIFTTEFLNFDDFYVMLNPDFKKLTGFELSSPRAFRRYSQLLSTLRSLHDRASYVRRLDGLAETGSQASLDVRAVGIHQKFVTS